MNHDNFVIWFKNITSWLYVPIYQNPIFFIDYWSFVHFWSGLMILVSLVALKIRPIYLWLTIILILYEVSEMSIVYYALGIFHPEVIKDQITDVVVGLSGGFTGNLLLRKSPGINNRIRHLSDFRIIISSLTIAFIGTGNFNYLANSSDSANQFNFPGFLCAAIAGILILQIYSVSFKRVLGRKQRLFYSFNFFCVLFLSGFLNDRAKTLSDHLFVFFIYGILLLVLAILFYEFLLVLFRKARRELK